MAPTNLINTKFQCVFGWIALEKSPKGVTRCSLPQTDKNSCIEETLEWSSEYTNRTTLFAEEIRELNDYLEEFNLTEIEYTEKDVKVKVSKSRISRNTETTLPNIEKNKNNEDTSIDNSKKITSPIIGTAYLAPEPGGKKFIEVGKKIKKGDTVMIVEAMKTMNHVPSPIDGTVKEISVEDGQPVEFGQALVLLK